MYPADEQSAVILKAYAAGDIGAADAAFEIQALGLPGFENPSASEIIIWAKAAGFGIPTPTRDEAREEAARIIARRKQ